jgi:hypothetical protein
MLSSCLTNKVGFGSTPLTLRYGASGAFVPLRALHPQRQSFQRGGGGPGPLSSSFRHAPGFGNLIEPAPILNTELKSATKARTTREISLTTMPVRGLITVEDLPPAI